MQHDTQISDRYALIFVNWNTPELTVKAVSSARATVASTDQLRIIIVDNGSADDSLEVFARELPEAEVLPMGANMGFAKAVNAGLRHVTEPYAFILNTDLEFRDNALHVLREALDGDPEAVLACPRLLRPDGSTQPAAVPEPKLWWELLNRSLPRHLMHVPEDQTSVVPSVVGPCMAVDMERLTRVGLLDERFFFFFEETDWCRRMNGAGFHILYVPSAEVVHLQGESANRRPIRARVQFYCSRYRYFRKHAGRAGVALLFCGLWSRLTLDILLHSLLVVLTGGRQRHRDRVVVYAVLWCWHLNGCKPKWGFEP